LTRLRRHLLRDASPGGILVALCVPLIFLYPNYQPGLTFAGVHGDLSDAAIAVVVAVAIVQGVRHGAAPLLAGRAVWLCLAAFLALILVSLSWARLGDPSYSLTGNLVSALKFVEYALLAPAAALALRRAADRRVFFWAVAIWSAFLTLIAVLQFLGDVGTVYGHHPNQREPSYLDEHDFAAFSGAAVAFALAALLGRRGRRLGVVGGVAGALGMAIAAALDSIGGLWVAAIATWGLARYRAAVTVRRTVAVVVLCGLVTFGAVSLRSSSIAAFLRFLGLEQETAATTSNVQSYAHRTLLGYIGLEIWLDHPVIGVGWQESKRPHAFEPHLASARRLFGSSEPPEAFPSPQHMWGVQNGIIQTLSDLGIVGLVVLVALLVAVVRTLLPVATRGPPPLGHEALVLSGWLIIGFAVFVGTGLIPGLTVDAQLWLAVGLSVALRHSLTPDG